MDKKQLPTYINKYLKDKFGERTLKICIDGGFTCPNRDGTHSLNGCIFCSERGSGDHLKGVLSIKDQIESYFNSYKVARANSFILYFQNFSNTYDTIENLKSKYDEAIQTFNNITHNNSQFANKKLVGLQIATRPDCITEDIARLLESYKKDLYTCVELGLQTANDDTKKFINTCYTNNDFTNAVNVLNKYNLDIVTHIMVGLPASTSNKRETHQDIVNTVSFLNNHKIQGVKIHSTYIVKNTILESLYKKGDYTPLTLDEYLDELEYILTHINQSFIIHRISGDAPKDTLIAPEWNAHKKWIINGIYKRLH